MPSPSMNKMVELAQTVNAVNQWEPKLAALSDSQLKDLTNEFKAHIQKKSQEIAALLYISPTTVRTHRYSIMRKLNLKSLADLIRYATSHELISTD